MILGKQNLGKPIRNNIGMSLIEVLVALLLTGLVTTAVFKLYITQHKNWNTQGDITDMQQNARAAIDELTRQIRMAGHQLPLGIDGVVGFDTNPDTIIINFSEDGCNAPIVKKMPNPSAELDCKGYDVSCFYEGQFCYIFHPDSGGGEFFEISHVQLTPGKIQHNKWPLTKSYDKDAIIMSLNQIKFFIDNTTNQDHPALMMEIPGQSPQIYAENITDLQFESRMKNDSIVDVPTIISDLREVLISIDARTNKPDYDRSDTSFITREYSSRVNLRNFDI